MNSYTAAKLITPNATESGGDVRDEILAWEETVNNIDGIQKIAPFSQNRLSTLLSAEEDEDSYLTSPAYYAFTGRNGLWLYEEGNAFIPFCWHPNVAGQILVFPTRGDATTKALENLLSKLPEPPTGLKLARIKENDVEAHSLSSSDFIFVPVIENVLDWKFPVRILSTDRVARMDGPDFRYIRNHVKHTKNNGAIAKDLNEVSHQQLSEFIFSWASQHTQTQAQRQEMVSLYEKILSFAASSNMKVQGFVVTMNDKVEALSMWDTSNQTPSIANRFVNLCNSQHRGLADFSTVCLAERLSKDGIKYVNVGGAETESLDQFKAKFMPAYSIELQSVEVVYNSFDSALRGNSNVHSKSASLHSNWQQENPRKAHWH